MNHERRPVIDRLMDKVRKDNNECWIFEGSKTLNGYGQIRLGGRRGALMLAHRVSYEHFVGPIDSSLDIDHLCFSRACVNPDHLRAVTRKQNMEHLRGAHKDSSTGVRGVTWRDGLTKPWRVRVKHGGTNHNCGYFSTLEEAEAVAIKKRAELFTHDDYATWQESRKEIIND